MARLLNVSMETGVPIVICLDGWVWWDGLSSMWNWWDPTLPGYDPNNVHNVVGTHTLATIHGSILSTGVGRLGPGGRDQDLVEELGLSAEVCSLV